MNQIQIANFLLTRKCNLKCGYCAIARNYDNMPQEYPKLLNYYDKELSTKQILTILELLKFHNKDIFVIFYGGEPMIRKDMVDIIKYSNMIDLNYTIITNNSDQVQENIKELLNKVEVKGITSSVDPIIYEPNHPDKDRYNKSHAGFKRLRELAKIVKDTVSEITVSNENVKHLHRLVKDLSEHNISSSITFIDIAKNKYYDFSNILDKNTLVQKSDELKDQLDLVLKDGLEVHMGAELINEVFNCLPSNYNCDIENDLHNITIDSDGTVRLCLRIRGVECPKISIYGLLLNDITGIKDFQKRIKIDKKNYCKGCNWTCMLMSSMVSKNPEKVDEILHTSKREG